MEKCGDVALQVLGRNPFLDITTKTRIRQLLQTHQGRDKLFKVIQYFLRIELWWTSVDVTPTYMSGANHAFTEIERNLMTIVNTRRLFRVGRFVAEFVRLRVTLVKCSELAYVPIFGGQWMALFIQCQMICDMIARALMFLKSFCEDVAFLVQKGFFHSKVADRLLRIGMRCAIPVLLTDLFLNSLRLYQGLLDASRPPSTASALYGGEQAFRESFSLLSRYDKLDKLRRRMAVNPGIIANGGENADVRDESTANKEQAGEDVACVNSYYQLLWIDFELHWVFVTQMKLLLDIFVATCNSMQWSRTKGCVSVAGLFSGILSVYRVWTYGR